MPLASSNLGLQAETPLGSAARALERSKSKSKSLSKKREDSSATVQDERPEEGQMGAHKSSRARLEEHQMDRHTSQLEGSKLPNIDQNMIRLQLSLPLESLQ